MTEPDWLRLNRANWDERVAIHRAHDSYEVRSLRDGTARLHPIEEAELGPVAGCSLLHLQCHFGRDTLILAQKGAEVTGLDFSGPAIEAARELAAELGIDAAFVEANIYDAPRVLTRRFDRVFTSWGTIGWLPDIALWARTAAAMLAPGGELYFADIHPFALAFDDKPGEPPPWFVPYVTQGAIEGDDDRDYADPNARLTNRRTHQFLHPLGAIVSALLDAGLTLAMLREHDALPWQAFPCLVEGPDRMFRWPGQRWLPLALSLKARAAP